MLLKYTLFSLTYVQKPNKHQEKVEDLSQIGEN